MDTHATVNLLKALADGTRLMIVGALLEKPHCVEELAQRLRRSSPTISFHLRKLEEAALVHKAKTQYYMIYELRMDLLSRSLLDLVRTPSLDDGPQKKRMLQHRAKVLRVFFKDGTLVRLPKQWKKRLIVLEEFMRRFESQGEYDEDEVNERIKTMFDDYCTIRRMLVDEGYMTRDGQTYRVVARAGLSLCESEAAPHVAPKVEEERSTMKTRAEIKREYKQAEKQAGVFQIKNKVNGKVLLGGSKNLQGPLNRHRFLLKIGNHPNALLQRDWNELGPEAFDLSVLEVVKKTDDPDFSLDDELTRLERAWVERLSPFGERGYNKSADIRD